MWLLLLCAFSSVREALLPQATEHKIPPAVATAISKAGANSHEILSAFEAASDSEEAQCLEYLIANMPQTDLESLTGEYILQNVRLALAARHDNHWAEAVPWDIFLDYVLPYASLTEPRDPWRPLFYTLFAGAAKTFQNLTEAALTMNAKSYSIVDPPIKFAPAPLNVVGVNHYSPFEVMAAHNASCTGLSVFLVDACRSIGVPARVAGTPHWNLPSCASDADPNCGNHNWVEVYVDEGWAFVDQDTTSPLNTGWFYPGNTQYSVPHTTNHSIFATSWKRPSEIFFPMVWDWGNEVVPAHDVTEFYIKKFE
jgi:hypothetical protein